MNNPVKILIIGGGYAGVAAAKKAGQLTAGHVIARPHRFTEAILSNADRKVVRALAD